MKINVFNDNGNKTVDWWFTYKLPEKVKLKTGASRKFKETSSLE